MMLSIKIVLKKEIAPKKKNYAKYVNNFFLKISHFM